MAAALVRAIAPAAHRRVHLCGRIARSDRPARVRFPLRSTAGADGAVAEKSDEEDTAEEEPEAEAESLDAFVARACARIGRGDDDAVKITAMLRANWFESPQEINALSTTELTGVGVPAKFAIEIEAMREEAAREAEQAAIAERLGANPAATSALGGADGWIGGALPGPDARLPRPTTGRLAATGRTALADVRVTRRKRLPPYSLRDDEIPGALADELGRMHKGVTSRRVGGAKAPVRVTTANNYMEVAKGLLGWYCRCKLGGWDGATPPTDPTLLKTHPANAPTNLSLRDVFPSPDAEGAALAIEYLQWLDEKRGVLPSTEAFQLRCLIALAKWLHGSQTNEHGAAMEQPVVMELVRVQRGNVTLATKGEHAADEDAKWLDWPDYLRLVERLRWECAPLTHAGDQRPDKDVAMAVQRYLLFAILACVPDRQRTLRELELGRTLACEEVDDAVDGEDGTVSTVRRRVWTVKHSPDDYKTGGAYGARPSLVLDERLYPALEAWLFGPPDPEEEARGFTDRGYSGWGWRACLSPNHNCVFSRPNGEPWNVSELSRTFSRAAMRLTGKKTNPHLVRDMVITHVRGEGIATDAELEALSLYMGHSIAMQKGTYDRRTQEQKVAPAIGLMSAINARAAEKKAR
jgi:hypothetical protein